MNYRYLGLLLSTLSGPLMAQTQFEQLHQIEVQQQQADAIQDAQQQRAYDAERSRQQAQEQAYQRQKQAAAQQAQAQALAVRKAKQEEQKRLQERDEHFEDEDRAMAIEERRLKLDAMKARAARTNDYIDAELRESAAKSDVIQSQADATRNVSTGTKSLMESTGDAEVNRSKKLFGN